MSGSIRLRLFLFALAGIAVALAVTGLGLTALFGRHVERRLGQELDAQVAQIAGNLRIAADGGLSIAREPADPRFSQPLAGLYWQVTDEKTGVLTRSRSLWDTQLDLPDDVLPPGVTHEHAVNAPDGQELILHEKRVILGDPGRDRPVRISVAVNRSELEPLRSGFARDLLPALAILGAILLGGAWLQVRAGLKPMGAVRKGLADIRSGAGHRLPTAVPDEVAGLVGGINELLDARDDSVMRARDRAADLAHGLKTPLTALSGDAARLRQRGEAELADDIDAVAMQMRRTIERELARSRLRHRGPRAEVAPIATAVDGVARTLVRTPAGEHVTFDNRVAGDAAVAILAEDLTEVMGNLMENAARMARSTVRVSADATKMPGSVRIEIEDDGDGVEAAEIGRLAARGRRIDEGGGSAGLGLAIVGDILAVYGSVPEFGRSALGGLSVGFVLPSA